MYVDDNVDHLKLVSKILGEEGYKVIQAKSGKECLAKLKQVKPVLILVDFFMPGMSGRQLLERIRKDPKFRDIKTAFITVAEFSLIGQRDIETLGSLDYIKKPFDPEDLRQRVKAILNKK